MTDPAHGWMPQGGENPALGGIGEPAAVVLDAFVGFEGAGGTVMALSGLSLAIGRAERLLIQGPNGSGKSTLLRVLTGEQPVTAGRVLLGGIELTALPATARRRLRLNHLGFVDQHAGRALLPEWTVLENVALQLRLAGATGRVARRAAGAQLDQLGLGRLAGRRIADLSGGEAQRVAICAAIAHQPTLVLADEPTGELDERAAAEVYELLAGIGHAQGSSLVLVSHDRRAGDYIDRGVRIRDGRLAEQWFPRDGPGRGPGSGPAEEQVIDARGWVRIPGELVGADPRPAALRATVNRAGELTLTPGRPGTARGLSDHRLSDHRLIDHRLIDDRPAGASVEFSGAVLPPPVPDPIAAAVVLNQVVVRYGSRTVIPGFDLNLQAGEWVVLYGPSGTGKSSLLKIIAGLLDPAAGAVRVAGVALSSLDRSARAQFRRDTMAVVPQTVTLAETLTVRENLEFAARLRGRPAEPSAGTVAADLGLTRLLEQQARHLSGGERQRVSVARSLIAQVPVLVLDEPTSQQDEGSAHRVAWAIGRTVASGRAVIAASHDPVFLTAAQRVITL